MRVHAASTLSDFSKCACSGIPETCPLYQTYVDITLLMVHVANILCDLGKYACSGIPETCPYVDVTVKKEAFPYLHF